MYAIHRGTSVFKPMGNNRASDRVKVIDVKSPCNYFTIGISLFPYEGNKLGCFVTSKKSLIMLLL